MPVLDLSDDILRRLVDYLDAADLRAMARINKRINPVVQSVQYACIVLGAREPFERCHGILEVQSAHSAPPIRGTIRGDQWSLRKVAALLSVISDQPILATYIRQLQIGTPAAQVSITASDLATLISACTNLIALKIHDCRIIRPADQSRHTLTQLLSNPGVGYQLSQGATFTQMEIRVQKDEWLAFLPARPLSHLIISGYPSQLTALRSSWRPLHRVVVEHLTLCRLGRWWDDAEVSELCEAFDSPKVLTIDDCENWNSKVVWSILRHFTPDIQDFGLIFNTNVFTVHESHTRVRPPLTGVTRVTTDDLEIMDSFIDMSAVPEIVLDCPDATSFATVARWLDDANYDSHRQLRLIRVVLRGDHIMQLASSEFGLAFLAMERQCVRHSVQIIPAGLGKLIHTTQMRQLQYEEDQRKRDQLADERQRLRQRDEALAWSRLWQDTFSDFTLCSDE
ncbi:hypothetical protein EMMF5_005782 [Cystobasidiomycetes sp. EMM_F5]